MLLHDARRDARIDADGDLVLLEDQDRARWDRAAIAEGLRARRPRAARAARRARTRCRRRSPRCTRRRARAADTDWRQIAALYDELGRVAADAGRRAEPRGRGRDGRRARRRASRSSTRSRATARSTATTCSTPRAPTCCAGSARAEAAAAYGRALALARCPAERRFLARRLAECEP